MCIECNDGLELFQAYFEDTLYTYCEDLNGNEINGCSLYDVEG